MPKTRAQIAAEIAANLPDNTSGDITPVLVRNTLSDIAASAPNIADDAALLSATLVLTADHTLLPTENGRLITLGNGQFTLSLGDIATFPTTFTVLLFHQGNSRITIQAFGSQTIVNAELGAENTKLMSQGESGFLTKIGTVWGFTKTNLTTLGDGLTSEVFNGTNRLSVIPATADDLGGIIVGSGLSVDVDGVLSATGGGSGSVTTVSVTTANGVSGSVANPTTTPAITIALGAITPNSVNGVVVSGSSTPTLAVTGTTAVSGTNTGDQTSVSGNAGTATALQTPRNINGVSFNGTANITVTAAAETLTGSALPALSGAALTALNASNLGSGTVPDARFPSTLPAVSGVNLTALNASNLGSGTVQDARFPATLPAVSGVNLTALNATNLGSGTVPDARFPATLPAVSGVNLTALNASNLGSGSVPAARMPALTGPVSTSAGAVATTLAWEIQVACSDTTTAITAGTAKVTFRMPFAAVLTAVRASVSTAPTGSTAIFDINESGTSVLSTKLSIDATEKTSVTAAVPPVISDASLADDAEITVDFDQVGSTIAGVGVIITLIGTRTS